MVTSITLNNRTVALRDFSIHDKRTFLTRNKESLVRLLSSDFPGIYDPSKLEPSQTVEKNGLKARVHFANEKVPRFALQPSGLNGSIANRLLDHKSKVIDAVTAALKIFSKSDDLKLPNHSVDIFVAEENTYSLGYLWWDEERTHAAIVIGKTAGYWSGDVLTKTVAQEVYEHYEPAWTVNELTKRILAILVHEMGHIFHQVNSLEYYVLMARCDELKSEPNGTTHPGFADLRNTTMPDVRSFIAETKSVAQGISPYAWQNGLNEFVAEGFCARVMGSPYGAGTPVATLTGSNATKNNIDAAYRACGGPEPEATICHRRS